MVSNASVTTNGFGSFFENAHMSQNVQYHRQRVAGSVPSLIVRFLGVRIGVRAGGKNERNIELLQD